MGKAKYDLDEEQVKPYFELNNVLENGVFYAATQLYGITFKERKDIPTYAQGMRAFEVFNADGSHLALFYCDYFKRDNKQGGAWMDGFVGQSKLMNTTPVVYNVANFAPPAPGEPALITSDDVSTMFHEFGHALHGMFSNAQYPTLSGTSTARDFVEFPSQFNEYWATYPSVFHHYAKHYKTGAPMPDELVEKIKKSRTFNKGYDMTELVAAAELDMHWHMLAASDPLQDPDAFERDALEKIKLWISYVPPRYRSSYFNHIWSGDYAAGYYAYLWTQMLADDAYQGFVEQGGLTRANGDRFRKMILSKGNTEDLERLYVDWRGAQPTIGPMLKYRGLGAGGQVASSALPDRFVTGRGFRSRTVLRKPLSGPDVRLRGRPSGRPGSAALGGLKQNAAGCSRFEPSEASASSVDHGLPCCALSQGVFRQCEGRLGISRTFAKKKKRHEEEESSCRLAGRLARALAVEEIIRTSC